MYLDMGGYPHHVLFTVRDNRVSDGYIATFKVVPSNKNGCLYVAETSFAEVVNNLLLNVALFYYPILQIKAKVSGKVVPLSCEHPGMCLCDDIEYLLALVCLLLEHARHL